MEYSSLTDRYSSLMLKLLKNVVVRVSLEFENKYILSILINTFVDVKTVLPISISKLTQSQVTYVVDVVVVSEETLLGPSFTL